MRGALVLCFAVMLAAPAAAQPALEPQDAEELSIQAFLEALETAVSTMDRARWTDLLSVNADRERALEFFDAMVPQGITRVVMKERDRSALAGTLPGEGYRLITEVFVEMGPRGRIATWKLDIRRPRSDEIERQPWRIVAQDHMSSIDGLHRLELHPEKQFAARNLVLRSVDVEISLPEGQVFVAETPEGITALVLLGDGVMRFAPAPKEERGQVRIFAGAEVLDAAFTAAFVRLNPYEFDALVGENTLAPDARDARAFRRAQEIFDEDVSNSFSLDLSDLSRDTWSLLPQPGDFVAEVRTRRYDQLTFARSTQEPEDVSLFQRSRKRNISIYASEQKLASRGRFYDEDDLVEYDVLDYTVDTTFTPQREWIEGRTRLRLRVRAFALSTIMLKLAEELTVNSVVSEELGRLLFLRVRHQNGIVVNLPSPVGRDYTLTLTVSYQGRLTKQGISDESAAMQGRPIRSLDQDIPVVTAEDNWLFSNRANWYPQATVTDYATATMRVTVPAAFVVVATGVEAMGSPLVTGVDANGQGGTALYVFSAMQPVRYLSMVVSRMNEVDAATVALEIVPPPAVATNGKMAVTGVKAEAQGARAVRRAEFPAVGSRNTVMLSVEANRRQEGRGRSALLVVADILRLYASLVGDIPYDSLTLAMVEAELPGGHAPGYMAVLNNPLPTSPFSWRNDPANFSGFPEFFMAHEVAHQWFGQAVGWKNYHEQWLSEGFAQYFAALFARELRGEGQFRDILKQFRRFAIEESDEGPVYLGYRLGHIKGESRVFRSLVYNKAASVLHMLRGLVGDEAFFRGIRRYYAENRFRKAGTDDLQAAMEKESGLDLTRFFERWIFDVGIPRLRYSTTTSDQDVTIRFEQTGEVYDLPVLVSLDYGGGRVVDHLVVIDDAVVEATFPLQGSLRRVQVNEDGGALANFDRAR